mmetsp:Transcript_15067/g.50593  ORF Transcript_15067/g.50593 Transcript_15067/m.50593 type:complete len:431 (+) Transcript_15067:181-1473(+)
MTRAPTRTPAAIMGALPSLAASGKSSQQLIQIMTPATNELMPSTRRDVMNGLRKSRPRSAPVGSERPDMSVSARALRFEPVAASTGSAITKPSGMLWSATARATAAPDRHDECVETATARPSGRLCAVSETVMRMARRQLAARVRLPSAEFGESHSAELFCSRCSTPVALALLRRAESDADGAGGRAGVAGPVFSPAAAAPSSPSPAATRSSSSSTTWSWPSRAATWRHVRPSVSAAAESAPRPRSAVVTLRWPFEHAIHSADLPSQSRCATSAPAAPSSSTVFGSPLFAACQIADCSSALAVFRSAPRSRRSRSVRAWPRRAAAASKARCAAHALRSAPTCATKLAASTYAAATPRAPTAAKTASAALRSGNRSPFVSNAEHAAAHSATRVGAAALTSLARYSASTTTSPPLVRATAPTTTVVAPNARA